MTLAGKKLSLFTLIIVLFGAAYLYYSGFVLNNKIQNKINSLTINQENIIKNNNIDFAKINNSIQALEHKFEQKKLDITLYQVNELINMANQALLVYNNIESTLKLLNYARETLNDEAQFISLKLALAHDIEVLTKLHTTDTFSLTSKIDNLTNDIINIKPPLAPIVKQSTTQAKWRDILNHIKTTLLSLVEVRRTIKDDNIVKLLPIEELKIKQNMQLDLISLRLALLQHNQQNWQLNLEHINKSINLFFADNVNIKNQINELLQIDISSLRANLDETIKALNKINSYNRDRA